MLRACAPSQLSAAALHAALRNASHPLQPYFRALPNPQEVWTYHSLPAAYLPLLENDHLVWAGHRLHT